MDKYNLEPAIIRDSSDSESSTESIDQEFERALDARYETIIIEQPRLGDETARWIRVGNYLHYVAVYTGISSIVVSVFDINRLPVTYVSLTVVSCFCTSLYMVCWQFDPCVKYQVTTDPVVIEEHAPFLLPISINSSPVVLIRQDDTKRKIVHCTVSLLAAFFTIYRVYKGFGK